MNRRTDTPARRDEDHDKVSAFNAWWDRWGKTIVWPALTVLSLYVKEHYLDRIETIPVLQAQQAAAAKIDTASLLQRRDIVKRLDGHDVMFQILVRMQCNDTRTTQPRDLARLCRELPELPTDQIRNILQPQQPSGGF